MALSTSLQPLAQARVLRQPAGFQQGHWAGAPGVYFAPDENAWYLTYRIRRPRGVAPDRGGEARIARSTDLENWTDIWTVTKDQFHSASIERCALRQNQQGLWHYFASYVDPQDGRWCVSLLQDSDIKNLNPANATPLFKAKSLGLEGIKDPWLWYQDRIYYLFLSVALPTPVTTAQSHASLDIFNTGQCLSATGLATSSDLASWQWQGVIFAPETNRWDAYCRRLNSLLFYQGKYLAFYDGSASHLENYEEKTGLAVSSNLRDWTSLTPDAPLLTSPHGSGSLRYLDAHGHPEKLQLFYECARPDGAHDLRLAQASLDSLARSPALSAATITF